MVDVFLYGFDIQEITHNVFYVVLILIGFDVIVGVLASAKERRLNSSINFEGLIRKTGVIVSLFFITFIDVYLKVDGLIINMAVGLVVIYKVMSIIENFSRIGINIGFLKKFFDPEKLGKDDNDENIH